MSASTAPTHKANLYAAAGVIISKELESSAFRVELPRESAKLETMSFGEAESLMAKAHGNCDRLSTLLAQASSALAYYRRFTAAKEKLLMGDPELQKDAKNEAQRERNVAMDSAYQESSIDLRTAEEVVAYLEPLHYHARETLQVMKKVRDAALERHMGTNRPGYNT
jgi:hypothetical protein